MASDSLLIKGLIFILLVSNIKSDIPVHCLQSQITGDWNLEYTDVYV